MSETRFTPPPTTPERGTRGRLTHDSEVYAAVQEHQMSRAEWVEFFKTKTFPVQELVTLLSQPRTTLVPEPTPEILKIEDPVYREQAVARYYDVAIHSAYRLFTSLLHPTEKMSWPPTANEALRAAMTLFIAERGAPIQSDLDKLIQKILDDGGLLAPENDPTNLDIHQTAEDLYNFQHNQDYIAILEDFYIFQRERFVKPIKAYLHNTRSSFEHRAILEEGVFRDHKTGLLNASGIELRYADLQARHAQALIIYFDINDFKKINDTLGHAAADEILRDIGASTQKHLRLHDAIGRTGGDEYMVFVEVKPEDVGKTVTRLTEKLGQPIQIPKRKDHEQLQVHISGGIAIVDTTRTTLHDASNSAELAAYLSKIEGLGSFLVDTEENIAAFRKKLENPETYDTFVRLFTQRALNRKINSWKVTLDQARQKNYANAIQRTEQVLQTLQGEQRMSEEMSEADTLIRNAADGIGTDTLLVRLVTGAQLPPSHLTQ